MIELRKLALRRGRTELFADATMTLTRGSRVGVVGRNGCGKSSLLAVFTGELQPDDGELEFPSDLVLAHVAQHAPSGTRAALEIVLDGDQELRAIEARLEDAENRHDGHAIALAHSALEDIDGYAAPARASAPRLAWKRLAQPSAHACALRGCMVHCAAGGSSWRTTCPRCRLRSCRGRCTIR